LVTNNLKDFPFSELTKFGLEAVNADTFLTDLLDLADDAVRAAIRQQSADTRNPPLTVEYILDALSRSGAPHFVQAFMISASDK
jgi:hypothetical protein